MKKIFKSFAFKIIAFLTSAILVLVFYTFLKPNNNIFSNILSYSTRPFQKGFWYVSNAISDFTYQFKEKEDFQKEIESLKSEINELRDKIVDYNEIKRENAKFAKYYNFKRENNSLQFVPASVIGMDSMELFGSFTIDKGSDSGISCNDIVITENGVIGCVYAVNAACSKVRSILSPDIKIGALDTDSNESGVISGFPEIKNENLTRMIFIPAQSNMKDGDTVATTGLSGMYPKNLKIGKVKKIDYDSHECSYYAVIEPFENLKYIRDVFVITDFEGKGLITNIDC